MAFSKRGLRLIEALSKFSRENPMYYDSLNIFNKIKFTAANDDQLKGTLTVDQSMCNGYNIMHEGFISLVIDSISSFAYIAKANGRMAYTINMSVNFLDTAQIGDKVTAEAKTVKSGMPTVLESKLYKENGALIAKGTVSFVSGGEASQRRAKHVFGFDVFKNEE